MSLALLVNEINNDVAMFINENYPHLKMVNVSHTKLWHSEDGLFNLSICEDRLIKFNENYYLCWQVQVSDLGVEYDVLNSLKEFMTSFKYKPVYDPEFEADGGIPNRDIPVYW